jgi:hypothetical protein
MPRHEAAEIEKPDPLPSLFLEAMEYGVPAFYAMVGRGPRCHAALRPEPFVTGTIRPNRPFVVTVGTGSSTVCPGLPEPSP